MNLQKLRLGQLKPAATTEAGDTHFSKVTAMFNFDGSHGDTTTSGLDASNKNLTLSYSSGDQLSNTQKKFGATSLYVADTVILSSSDGFDMGTGDFTMEAWFYFTSFANSFALFDQWDTSGSTRHQVWHSAANGGRLSWYYAGTSGFHSANPAVSTGAWTHIAFVRYSGTLKMYINGTAESNTASHSGQFGRSHTMYFGHQHGGGGGAGLFYMDDLRITKGLARYTSNFTAPTSTHLTVEGDSLKQVIVNEDADSIIVGTGGINTTRIAKAWVNFNGTGTVAIRGAYNISSITDNGTGYYSLNFSSNMTDVNYSAVGMAHEATDSASVDASVRLYHDSYANVMQASQVRIATGSTPTGGIQSYLHQDSDAVMVTVFGN